jgi:hypothetical protein
VAHFEIIAVKSGGVPTPKRYPEMGYWKRLAFQAVCSAKVDRSHWQEEDPILLSDPKSQESKAELTEGFWDDAYAILPR